MATNISEFCQLLFGTRDHAGGGMGKERGEVRLMRAVKVSVKVNIRCGRN